MENITITLSLNSEEKDYLNRIIVITRIYLVIFVVSSTLSAFGFVYDYYKFEDLKELISEKLLFKQNKKPKKSKGLV